MLIPNTRYAGRKKIEDSVIISVCQRLVEGWFYEFDNILFSAAAVLLSQDTNYELWTIMTCKLGFAVVIDEALWRV